VLDPAPEDARKIWVSVDGVWLDEENMNGFTYDSASSTLELHGAACDNLQDVQPNDPPLAIELGCGECFPNGATCETNTDCCSGVCGGGMCLVN